ncbi:MAG: PEP/pyruvate-binding domain-containing protein [Acidimicrobiia bacterium]
MSSPLLPLDSVDATDAARVGAKAAALATMTRAGIAVPAGFVIEAAAFHEVVAVNQDRIAVLLRATENADPATLEETCDRVRSLITASDLAEELGEELGVAYATLGSPMVAVRSSATAEDLGVASFAGQYDSVLGVRRADDLVAAVLRVWASLFSTRAVAYRARLGVDHRALAMAVIVQELLPAEAAGVLFTRDPISGDDGLHVVNVALGLGEGVVAGLVPVDRHRLHADTGQETERNLAYKDSMVVIDDDGLRTVAVPEARRAVAALDERALSDLGELASALRTLFGDHRDIEFALYRDAVYALQARPITGLDAADDDFPVVWDDPTDATYQWMLRGASPSLLLERDIMTASAARQRIGFAETGSPMMRMHILRFVDGWPYVRGPDTPEDEVAARQQQLTDLDDHYTRLGTSIFEAEIEPVLLGRLAELRRTKPRGRALTQHVDHLELAMAVHADAMGNLHWRMRSFGRPDWTKTYTDITGRPATEAPIFLQALTNRTTRLITSLRKTARIVQADPVLLEIFDQRAWARLDDPDVRQRPAAADFRASFARIQRGHGLRTGMGMGSVANFTSPTWGMEPSIPLGIIASYTRQDLDVLDARGRDIRRERRSLERSVRRGLASDPDALARFEFELRRVVCESRTTEDHNHLMEQACGGYLREAVYGLGTVLVADGLLDAPDDVFHLSLAELRAIANGAGPTNTRELVRERAAERDYRARHRPPRTIGAADGPGVGGGFPMSGFGAIEGTGLDGSVLRGIAASPGRATGPARVVMAQLAPPDVRPGDVLVASIVGEAWTPIFPLLGGLVLDAGGVFQHSAVVTREYRIPAVFMTREATKVIREGQLVTVDGDQGVVELAP